MTQDAGALLPCPFCGSPARYDGMKCAVVCTNEIRCAIKGPSTYDRAKGIERWNARQAASPGSAGVSQPEVRSALLSAQAALSDGAFSGPMVDAALKDIAAALATRPADTSSSEREVVALADKIHDACPHNLGFGNCENGPVGCAIVSKDFECVCEHVHMHAIRAARSVNPVLNALVDLHAVARVDRDEDYAAITNAAAVIEAAGSGCVAQGVKDPILTPRHFLDDILSACDASNWDADRNKGDYYRGLNDAYEVILTIAVEYQTSIYAWCKREASPVPSADREGK